MSRGQDFKAGIKQALPIIMGYLPIGIAYGLLAGKTGLGIIGTVLMSLFVYAGSSQLICVDMLGQNTGILTIIMMTFVVNLRHLLMSASLSLNLKNSERKMLPIMGFFITDETFAVGSSSIKNYEHREYFFLGLGLVSYLSWSASSWLGAALGNILPELNSAALDFVLPAMFIALLILQLKARLDIVVAFIAGLLSLLFLQILPGNWNIITATVISATVGVGIDKWKGNI